MEAPRDGVVLERAWPSRPPASARRPSTPLSPPLAPTPIRPHCRLQRRAGGGLAEREDELGVREEDAACGTRGWRAEGTRERWLAEGAGYCAGERGVNFGETVESNFYPNFKLVNLFCRGS